VRIVRKTVPPEPTCNLRAIALADLLLLALGVQQAGLPLQHGLARERSCAVFVSARPCHSTRGRWAGG